MFCLKYLFQNNKTNLQFTDILLTADVNSSRGANLRGVGLRKDCSSYMEMWRVEAKL
jgi:hypothetical protein